MFTALSGDVNAIFKSATSLTGILSGSLTTFSVPTSFQDQSTRPLLLILVDYIASCTVHVKISSLYTVVVRPRVVGDGRTGEISVDCFRVLLRMRELSRTCVWV